MKNLGAVLKGWRESRRMGVREAAKLLNISHSTLSRIERGLPADGKTLARLLVWMIGPSDGGGK